MTNPWTPGPWRVEQGTTLVWGHCDPDDRSANGMGYPVAEAQARRGWQTQGLPTDDEIDANARLIAAAPEMAELLERVIDVFAKWTHGKGGIVHDAEQILARIRGEAA